MKIRRCGVVLKALQPSGRAVPSLTRTFLRMFEGADPDIPAVAEARDALQRLGG